MPANSMVVIPVAAVWVTVVVTAVAEVVVLEDEEVAELCAVNQTNGPGSGHHVSGRWAFISRFLLDRKQRGINLQRSEWWTFSSRPP